MCSKLPQMGNDECTRSMCAALVIDCSAAISLSCGTLCAPSSSCYHTCADDESGRQDVLKSRVKCLCQQDHDILSHCIVFVCVVAYQSKFVLLIQLESFDRVPGSVADLGQYSVVRFYHFGDLGSIPSHRKNSHGFGAIFDTSVIRYLSLR